jgi:hypothetical protein
MTPGVMFAAGMLVKLATAGTLTTTLVAGIKWFNTFEFNFKKRGAGRNDSPVEIESLREKIGSRR